MTAEVKDFEIEIDLKDIFFFLLKKIWVIILVALMALGVGYAVSKYILTPKFEAVSQVYIMNKNNTQEGISIADMQTGAQLTNDYREIIRSRPVLENVKNNLNLTDSIAQLREMISVDIPTGTRILRIVVLHPNPATSMNIANQLQIEASSQIATVMSDVEVSEVEEAAFPSEPASPNIMINSIIAAVLGAALAVGILVLVYMLDDTIKTPEDVEKYLNISVLGAVPDKQRLSKGKRGVSSYVGSNTEMEKMGIEAEKF